MMPPADPPEPPAGASRHLPPLPRPGDAVPHGIQLGGFGEVLRRVDFRLLFMSQAISGLGDWVGTFAFIVAAQRLAPDQPVAVGAVLVIRLLPSIFATPIGGVLSDRWDRKRIMINTTLVRIAAIFAVPLIPRLYALYLLAFLIECLALLFLPARDASVPNLVGKERLEAANALLMGSSYGSMPLAAPLFGGLAFAGSVYPNWLPLSGQIHEYPFTFPFFFNAFTHALSVLLILRITIPRAPGTVEPSEEPFWTSLAGGVRYIASRPFLRGLGVAVSAGMLGGGVLFAVGVGYVKESLGGTDVEFGWLMGIFGGGMAFGFLLSQVKPERGVAWLLRATVMSLGGVLVFMSLANVLWIAYLLAAVFGVAFSVSLIVAMSAVQAHTADRIRGRVMAAVHMLVRGALVVGALGGGAVASIIIARGWRFSILGYAPDANQIALVIAGTLIAAGTLAIRSPESGPAPGVPPGEGAHESPS